MKDCFGTSLHIILYILQGSRRHTRDFCSIHVLIYFQLQSLVSMAHVTYSSAGIFTCPPRSVLAVSCHCVASPPDPASIMHQLKTRFPAAYETYLQTCSVSSTRTLGTCLLVPDQDYWIAFLFTSPGRAQTVPSTLEATRAAITDLLRQLHTDRYMRSVLPGDEYIPTINAPRLNYHDLGVPWELTAQVLTSFPFKFRIFL